MIKTIGGLAPDYSEICCDICGNRIAICKDFEFKEGQQIQYSAWLCESCGRKRNESDGKDVKQIQKLEKTIKDLLSNQYLSNCQAIIVETYQKYGIEDLDYFKEDKEE